LWLPKLPAKATENNLLYRQVRHSISTCGAVTEFDLPAPTIYSHIKQIEFKHYNAFYNNFFNLKIWQKYYHPTL
jgi:hypothetical protein